MCCYQNQCIGVCFNQPGNRLTSENQFSSDKYLAKPMPQNQRNLEFSFSIVKDIAQLELKLSVLTEPIRAHYNKSILLRNGYPGCQIKLRQ